MNDRAFPSHAVANMSLRAPRVALVIPLGDDWHHMAMHGMYALSCVWGGAGFVVIPVGPTGVHPAVIAAMREYDPDAVLIPPADSFMAEEHRKAVLDAQMAISAACSNYRLPIAEAATVAQPAIGDLWNALFDTGGPGSGQPTALEDLLDPRPPGVTIGVNPAVGGAVGLSAATRWGLSEPPVKEQADIEAPVLHRAVRRLASHIDDPTDLLGITNRDNFEGPYATDLALTLYGLDGAQGYGPVRPDALVVWGDQPADFALAMVWQRTYRMGVWVPDEWWRDETLRNHVFLGIERVAGAARPSFRRILFTSTSLSREDLAARADQCRNAVQPYLRNEVVRPSEESVILPAENLPFSRYWKTHYVLAENLSDEWSTTVYESADTIEFAMLPRVPLISVRGLEALERKANWHVDVTVRSHDIPIATAIPEQALLAEGEDPHPVRIRAGRNGISYEAYRTDFIPSGATISQSLTRPLLRFPSLLAWADARASTHDMTVRPSTAGVQATVLATMMGGRQALTELVSSELLPALKAFNARGSTREAYRAGEGCVVNNEGYLNFEGMCRRARTPSDALSRDGILRVGIQPDAIARDKIDALLRTGILRRGLIIRCPTCNHLAFVNVESVGSTIHCPRCLSDYLLERERWRWPMTEPKWFYDLHPTARALLESNGDVPLLLSQYLRGTSGSFSDTPEFELIQVEGGAELETDLLALVDRKLVLAEAKSNATFGNSPRAPARKRAMAAKLFQVDEIILATTADVWDPASVTAMKSAIRMDTWPVGRRPVLRKIRRLGGDSVSDEVEVVA